MKRWLPIAAALLAVAVLLGAMQLLNQTPQKPMEMGDKSAGNASAHAGADR